MYSNSLFTMTTKSTKNSRNVGTAVARLVLTSKVLLNSAPCMSDLFEFAIKRNESGHILNRPECGYYSGEIPNG